MSNHSSEDSIECFSMGRLEGAELAEFEEHLLECVECQEAVRGMDSFLEAMKSLPTEKRMNKLAERNIDMMSLHMPSPREAYEPEPAARPTLFLTDQHLLVIEALSLFLAPNFSVLGITDDERSVVRDVHRLEPDITVVGFAMPENRGLELAKAISETAPATKVIFLTMHATESFIDKAFSVGACGCVSKGAAPSELMTALRTVLSGKTYRSPQRQSTTPVSGSQLLSERERTVLQLVAQGHSAKQVAGQLGISSRTAEFHKTRIRDKLAIRTTAELTRYAIAQGL